MKGRRVLALALAGCVTVTTVGLSGCKGNKGKTYSGTHEKTSEDMLVFETSDEDMTFFLNDFFKRHIGYVDENGTDYSVTTLKPGLNTTNTFYQEWMSKSLFWFNSSTGLETDRYTSQKNRLESLPVDDYGYVWCDDDVIRTNAAEEYDGLHRMGWPFPSSKYENSHGYCTSWMFNGDGSDTCDWNSNFGAGVDTDKKMMVGDFTDQKSVSYDVTMSVRSGGITPYFAPWLELDLRMALDNPENVDDVYVWFTNGRDEEFSEEKCVSAKEWAAIHYDFTADYQHLLYFPMYAHSSWGEWKNPEDNTHKIYRLKVEIRAKDGKTISGTCGLNSVRSDYDTRHANNNGIYLTSLYDDLQFTGDTEYLLRNLTKARKAMNLYMQMYSDNRDLIRSSYFVGHDGDKSGEYEGFNIIEDNEAALAMERASALGNGYFDASYMSEYDFHTNLYFYKGLQSMIALEKYVEEHQDELEEQAKEQGVSIDKKDATIRIAERAKTKYTAKTKDEEMLTSSSYTLDSAKLTEIADKVLQALREECNDEDMTGFYNTETGRFAGGYDINTGTLYDFGYTQYNLEAVYLGVATKEQSESIMDWISGERIVESDKTDDTGKGDGNAGASGVGGSTGEDIYFFDFAPRITTVNQTSPSMLNGVLEADRKNDLSVFGVDEVQFGGAFLWTSFYDIMARLGEYGADDAYERLEAIEKWYNNIYKYFVSDEHQVFRKEGDSVYYSYFYHDYYYNHPFKNGDDDVYLMLQGGRYGTGAKQGGNASGVMGIDSELVESILLIATVPLGFFGLSGSDGTTLNITPSLPESLNYWKIENLMFNEVKYDLTILEDTVRIDAVRGDAEGLTVKVTMDIKAGQNVYVNGEKTKDYVKEDGKAVITVPLQNNIIEVR